MCHFLHLLFSVFYFEWNIGFKIFANHCILVFIYIWRCSSLRMKCWWEKQFCEWTESLPVDMPLSETLISNESNTPNLPLCCVRWNKTGFPHHRLFSKTNDVEQCHKKTRSWKTINFHRYCISKTRAWLLHTVSFSLEIGCFFNLLCFCLSNSTLTCS